MVTGQLILVLSMVFVDKRTSTEQHISCLIGAFGCRSVAELVDLTVAEQAQCVNKSQVISSNCTLGSAS